MRPLVALGAWPLALTGQVAADLLRSSKEAQVPPAHPIGHVDEPFARPAGRLFEVNGQVGFLTGTNAWYLNRLDEDDMETALAQIIESGYTIIRVWAFGEIDTLPNPRASDPAPMSVYFHYINATGGYVNYGADGLERFDRLVSRCETLGLKLVLPLYNYWGDYGGRPLYLSALTTGDDGEELDWSSTWYDRRMAQEVYRDYAKVIIERYRESPAVFSWQLGNEPRCPSCDGDDEDIGATLVRWARSMSDFVKDLDPHHMLSMGDEGWLTERERAAGYGDDGHGYSGMNGVDWAEIMSIEALDYGTVHLWPDHWAYPYEWGVQWIEEHDQIAAKFNKPIILEEYGAARKGDHVEPMLPWQDALVASGFAADQTWQFEPDGTAFTDYPDPQFALHYGSDEWDVLARNHSRRIAAKTAALGTGAGGAAVRVHYSEFV